MAAKSVTKTLGAATRRVPGLRRVPVVALVSAAEVALLARNHLMRLTPHERHRLVGLVRAGRGRPSRLTAAQRRELEGLLDKLEARTLLGDAVSRLSPVRLPRRLVYGRR
jgi:hypothetical protein